jgi:hypothetical protein
MLDAPRFGAPRNRSPRAWKPSNLLLRDPASRAQPTTLTNLIVLQYVLYVQVGVLSCCFDVVVVSVRDSGRFFKTRRLCW